MIILFRTIHNFSTKSVGCHQEQCRPKTEAGLISVETVKSVFLHKLCTQKRCSGAFFLSRIFPLKY